jgi:hypothetical protein
VNRVLRDLEAEGVVRLACGRVDWLDPHVLNVPANSVVN